MTDPKSRVQLPSERLQQLQVEEMLRFPEFTRDNAPDKCLAMAQWMALLLYLDERETQLHPIARDPGLTPALPSAACERGRCTPHLTEMCGKHQDAYEANCVERNIEQGLDPMTGFAIGSEAALAAHPTPMSSPGESGAWEADMDCGSVTDGPMCATRNRLSAMHDQAQRALAEARANLTHEGATAAEWASRYADAELRAKNWEALYNQALLDCGGIDTELTRHKERLEELEQRLARVAELAHDRDDDSHEWRSRRLGQCASLAWCPKEEALSTDPLKRKSTLKWAKLAHQLTESEDRYADLANAAAPVLGVLAVNDPVQRMAKERLEGVLAGREPERSEVVQRLETLTAKVLAHSADKSELTRLKEENARLSEELLYWQAKAKRRAQNLLAYMRAVNEEAGAQPADWTDNLNFSPIESLSALDRTEGEQAATPPEPPAPIEGVRAINPADTYAAWRDRPAIDWELCACPKGKPSSPTRPGSAIVVGHGPHCGYIAARCDRDNALIDAHKAVGGEVDWAGEPMPPDPPAERPLGEEVEG